MGCEHFSNISFFHQQQIISAVHLFIFKIGANFAYFSVVKCSIKRTRLAICNY